ARAAAAACASTGVPWPYWGACPLRAFLLASIGGNGQSRQIQPMLVAHCAGRGQSLRAQRLPSPTPRKEARAPGATDAFGECRRQAGCAVGLEQHGPLATRLRRIRRNDVAPAFMMSDCAICVPAGATTSRLLHVWRQELPLNRSLTRHLLCCQPHGGKG